MGREREARAYKSAGQADTWQVLIAMLDVLGAPKDSGQADTSKMNEAVQLLGQAKRMLLDRSSLSGAEAAKRQINAINLMERAIPLLERQASGGPMRRGIRGIWTPFSSLWRRGAARDAQLTLEDDIPDLVSGLLGDLAGMRTRIQASGPQAAPQPGVRQAIRAPGQKRGAPQVQRGGKRHRAGFRPAH